MCFTQNLKLFIFVEIAVATNDVWGDIGIYLNSKMSTSALHTFVYKGRYGIKDRLGLIPEYKTFPKPNICLESGLYYFNNY